MSALPSWENLPTVKTVQCSCGYVASGETAEDLLADVEAHIEAEHRPQGSTKGTATAVTDHRGDVLGSQPARREGSPSRSSTAKR
jgi:hypothetical protein